MIRPIRGSVWYWLTNTDLLNLLLEEYTQNSNGNLSAVLWSMVPKVHCSSAKAVEIAYYIVTSIIMDARYYILCSY